MLCFDIAGERRLLIFLGFVLNIEEIIDIKLFLLNFIAGGSAIMFD